jgi:hypothetical protein
VKYKVKLLKDKVDGIIKINNNAFKVWKMTEFIIQVKNTEKAGKAKASLQDIWQISSRKYVAHVRWSCNFLWKLKWLYNFVKLTNINFNQDWFIH